MTTTRHSERPSAHAHTGRRRTTAAHYTPAELHEREHITRVVASAPVYTQWMRDIVADVIAREAARLADRGHHPIAVGLAERSAGYRNGTLAVW